jgi:hypothetical protein
MSEQIDYAMLAQALLQGVGQKEVGGVRYKTTPNAYYGHGPGGLFSTPGLAKPLFSAMVLPRVGLQSILPVVPTNETDPLFGIITGVTSTVGSEPSGVCDDPPVSGVAKLCTHTFPLGRVSRKSKIYDLDRIGKITNRGEFTDFRVFGDPTGVPSPQTPSMPGLNPAQIAQNEMAKALFELAVTWSRDFAQLVYTGSPTNNPAGGGYKEFYGLETLVNTGYRDAVTGVACPAADSIVRTFGGLNISTNAAGFIRNITNMYRNLRYLATRAGLSPVEWVLSMPFGLFYEATEIWPIAYLTYRALAIPEGSTNNVNATDVEAMRNEMRGDLMNYQGQFLLIDGQKVPVVLDDAIPETDNGDGSFTSDVYFIPKTVMGGQPVTYMEYFNYEAPNASMEAAKLFAAGDMYYTSDSGRFMWHRKPPENWCVHVVAKTEPRLILLTPYLAARLTNVMYLPVWHERSPFTDNAYFVDGGQTTYPAPSFYSPVSG